MPDRTDSYYASEAFSGYGCQLEVGNGASPEVFEAVAFVVSITPGAMSTTVIDRTHLRSPAAHMEKMAGMRDSAAFTAELRWAPKEQSHSNQGGGSGAFASGGLVSFWIDRQERNYKIVLPDGSPATSWPFRAIVTRFQPSAVSGNEGVNCTVEFTPVRDFSASLP